MGPEQKRLMDRLFNDPTRRLRNFHITPGDKPATAEEICAEVNKGIDEVERMQALEKNRLAVEENRRARAMIDEELPPSLSLSD